MREINVKAIFAPRNRGILLDVVVFLFSLTLMRLLTIFSLKLVDQAEEDVSAKVAVGLFFVALFFLQPLGPILKRWSFHQRYKSFTLEKADTAGCLLFWYMFFYVVIMLIISGAATIILSDVVFEKDSKGGESAVIFILGGAVLSFVNAVIIFRYFLKPKREPRWKFLKTPQAEILGDACMFLNVICFQILWSSVTVSPLFWESLRTNVHGKPTGFLTGIFLRFFTVAFIALLVYFPPRIFYLVIDRRRKIIWLTMLLANLPLIFGVVFLTPNVAGNRQANTATASTSQAKKILSEPSFVITAEAFFKEYKLDSQAGAQKYYGRYVNVTGRVKALDLRENSTLNPDVRLDGGGRLQWVYCRFDDEQIEEMRTLKVDQRVTLQGIGDRFWIGGPSLKHCLLVSGQ